VITYWRWERVARVVEAETVMIVSLGEEYPTPFRGDELPEIDVVATNRVWGVPNSGGASSRAWEQTRHRCTQTFGE